MNNQNNKTDKQNKHSDDVDEMIKELEKHKDSTVSQSKITESLTLDGFSFDNYFDGTTKVSVLELNPSTPSNGIEKRSLYYVIEDIANNFEENRRNSKNNKRTLKKIHHDLMHFNNNLTNIQNSLYINNLFKLFEHEQISEETLSKEIKKIYNIEFVWWNENE